MVSINNMSLRTKALVPMALMGAVVLLMVAFGASRLMAISGEASHIIETRDLAATRLSQAARNMLATPYAVFGALVFDAGSPRGQAAIEGFPKAEKKALSFLDEAATLVPDRAAEIRSFKTRFVAIAQKAGRPFRIGHDSPSLDRGSRLKADDLDKMAEGAREMAEVDSDVQALNEDIVTFDHALIDENAQAATGLRAQSKTALITMGCVGLSALLLSGAFSVWMTSRQVAAPLSRLARTLRLLAEGDLTVEVDGRDRHDEIGGMSTAVDVLKSGAIERRRLEAEAAAARAEAEAERERVAEERLAAAQEQANVVQRLGRGLQQLAKGDLTAHLEEGFSEAYGQMRDDFNGAVDTLRGTMEAVVASAHAIRSGTEQISAAAHDLSSRTEHQAASLEETAASLDQITENVGKTSEGSKRAQNAVANAKADAEDSGKIVGRAVTAMTAIETASREVGQIISVIDEIAFQTSLLALNAGVEAARAGDAGRGFAVVAYEVRSLAQRSAASAKEIKSLISASNLQVAAGVELVGETGRALDRIMAHVADINVLVCEIATGTHEQSASLKQVNAAIGEMDQATQQNAAMVEQSTAASAGLKLETDELGRLIAAFRIEQGNAETVAPVQSLRPSEPPIRQRAPAAPVIALRAVGRAAGGRRMTETAEAAWTEF